MTPDEPGPLSLLPIAATLIVALLMRNVLLGLFVGVLVGATMVVESSVLQFLPRTLSDFVVPQVADGYNASVIVLLAFIGGFVKLIEFSGAGRAFAMAAARRVAGRVGAQLGAWFGGIAIFFSDLGTPLIVGPVFQSLFERAGLSRQKLAFILDSTSSPVAILIPFIGWGVFIMSVLADAFADNKLAASEWDAFVAAIPYQLYAWLAIAVVPLVVWLRVDLGAMGRAESAARQSAATASEASTVDQRARPSMVWLPLLVLGASLFLTLGELGFPFEPVPGSAFRAGLAAAYLLAAVTLTVLMLRHRLAPFATVSATYVSGMAGMLPIAATLVLAWSLGALGEALGTGPYVARIAGETIAAWGLPAMVFLLAGCISFATGSSWGTIVIMMPLAVPAALATDAAMAVVVGAVLSGGLFGDHASPVSETTILSSTGAATPPMEHFVTQLPYALMNGALALGGFLAAGFFASPWAVLPLLLAQAGVVVALGRAWRRSG